MLRTVAEFTWRLGPGSLVPSWVVGTKREHDLAARDEGRGSQAATDPESRVSRNEWPGWLRAPRYGGTGGPHGGPFLQWEKAWGEVGWG